MGKPTYKPKETVCDGDYIYNVKTNYWCHLRSKRGKALSAKMALERYEKQMPKPHGNIN